jgi:hypothetical protein
MSITLKILVGLELILLVSLFYVNLHANCPSALKTSIDYSFNGFSGALLLALKSSCSTCDSKPKDLTHE